MGKSDQEGVTGIQEKRKDALFPLCSTCPQISYLQALYPIRELQLLLIKYCEAKY